MQKHKNLNFLSILQEHGAFTHGHFELPSGLHSEVYIHTHAAVQHPVVAQKIAKAMAEKFPKKCDLVLASSQASSIIGQEVARIKQVRAIFAHYEEDGALALKKNFIIKPEEEVLIVDDVAVTGNKILRAINLVRGLGAKVIGVAVVVDRSMGYLPLNAPLRAVVSYPLKTYHPQECPLCAAGHPLEKTGRRK